MLAALRACLFAALICAVPAFADDWAGPVIRETFSASRDHFVRVIPGTSIGETTGFAVAPKGPHATAEFYRRQPDRSYRLMYRVTLLNPVAPADFFVSNQGGLVTVDNWHNRGYGIVLAAYDYSGRLVKAYALTDLFAKAEIDSFSHSVSSIWWHNGPVYINPDQRTLYMRIASGRDLVLDIETGRFAYCESRRGKYLCRTGNQDRWMPYGVASSGGRS
jgi:hypothetical protein